MIGMVNKEKEKIFGIKLDDKDYEAMLLSYLLKLSSFELAKRKLSAEIAEKENVTDEDVKRLEAAEKQVTDVINVIDYAVFTPCLINYMRKYHDDKIGMISSDKGKIITMINNEAKAAIEKEVEQFERLEKGNDDK